MKRVLTMIIIGLLCVSMISMMSLTTLPGIHDVRAVETSMAKVYVSPKVYTATLAGETFAANVDIANVSNLQAFEFKLWYNTTILDALEVVEGSFLRSFGTTFSVKLEINETLGFVYVVNAVLGATPAQGDGTLATVSFRCNDVGECVFDLYDTKLVDSNGLLISSNSDCPQSYDVIGPPVWSYTFAYMYWYSPPEQDPCPLPGGVWDGFCFDKMTGVTDAYVDGEAAAAGWKVTSISSTTVVFSAEDVMTSGTWSGFHIVAPEANDGPVDWFCDHGAGAGADNDLLHGPNPPEPQPPSLHDVAVTNVIAVQTSVRQGVLLPVTATVENHGVGGYTETFDVNAYYGNATITHDQWEDFWSMGDVNRDGYINWVDGSILAKLYGQSVPPGHWADLIIDGKIDIKDLATWAKHFGREIWPYFVSGAVIGIQTVNSLSPWTSRTLVFTWDTVDVDLGTYTISAYAVPVYNVENDRYDNNFGDGLVTITPAVASTVDIDPDTLNLKSTGEWITAYIELLEGYDVHEVNVSSIRLNGTIPVDPAAPVTFGDHDADGAPDLMVKFARNAVITFIYDQGIRYDNVILTVRGKLNDGTPFKGSDVIKVIFPDLNNDRKVDIIDLAIVTRAFGTNPSSPVGPTGNQWNPTADINRDGRADIRDLATVANNYGAAVP